MKIIEAPPKKFITTRDLVSEGYQNLRGLKTGIEHRLEIAELPWHLHRAGYQISPKDLEVGVWEELGISPQGWMHPRFSSVKLQKVIDLFGRRWADRRKTRDAIVETIAYAEAAGQGFGGGARGLWMKKPEPDLGRAVFHIERFKTHVLGFRQNDEEIGPYLDGPTRVTFAGCVSCGWGGVRWFRTGDLRAAKPWAPTLLTPTP